MIEKLEARLPPTSSVDDFDEVYFLKYTQGMIRPLKEGLSTTIQQAHRVVQCQQGKSIKKKHGSGVTSCSNPLFCKASRMR
jgi:hypothetical protein